MTIKISREERIANRVERKMDTAKKKAGRKFVTDVVKDQRAKVKQNFPKTGKRRKVAVQGFVSKHGNRITFKDFSPGAEAHEDGAIVRPKNGKFLAIKGLWAWHGANYNQYGKEQSNLQDMMKAGETFILKKGNRAIVMRKANAASVKRTRQAKKAGDIEKTQHGDAFPIATLVRSVRLRPRLGMHKTVKRHFDDYMKNLDEEIIKADL